MRTVTFNGGVHPATHKRETVSLPIEAIAAPALVSIIMQQHTGAPAHPCVAAGTRVRVGELIGQAQGAISANIHSSVSGFVKEIASVTHPTTGLPTPAVIIENDYTDEAVPYSPLNKSWYEAAPQELIERISAAGIVGLGGACFPTQVKLSPPSNKPIDTIIINGCECEPYLSADHRLMLEHTDAVLRGALIIRRIIGAKRIFIALENNKPDARTALLTHCAKAEFKGIVIVKAHTKYPQGSEKQLIKALTKREVPSGGLPMDTGCLVHNVGTAMAIYKAVSEGIPLYERVITVAGPTIGKPGNYRVRIGTPIAQVLEACSINWELTTKIICGGPMMGIAQTDKNAPVIKSTSGLLALNKLTPAVRDYPCINCGSCVKACPIHLVPTQLARTIEKDLIALAQKYHIADCIECGSCAYVCPSKINLVHFMKLGKLRVRTLATKKP